MLFLLLQSVVSFNLFFGLFCWPHFVIMVWFSQLLCSVSTWATIFLHLDCGATHLIPLVFHCVILVVEQCEPILATKGSYRQPVGDVGYLFSKLRLVVDHFHPNHPTRAASLDSVKEEVSYRHSHYKAFEAHTWKIQCDLKLYIDIKDAPSKLLYFGSSGFDASAIMFKGLLPVKPPILCAFPIRPRRGLRPVVKCLLGGISDQMWSKLSYRPKTLLNNSWGKYHLVCSNKEISQLCMLMMFTVSVSSQPEQLSSFRKV